MGGFQKYIDGMESFCEYIVVQKPEREREKRSSTELNSHLPVEPRLTPLLTPPLLRVIMSLVWIDR